MQATDRQLGKARELWQLPGLGHREDQADRFRLQASRNERERLC